MSDNTCTQGPEQRAKTAEKVLSPEEILPFLYGLEPEDRIQGHADAPGFHDGERQDHAAADYGKLRKTSAGIDRGHQEGADDRPAALCRVRRINGNQTAAAPAHPSAAAASGVHREGTGCGFSPFESHPAIHTELCSLLRTTISLRDGFPADVSDVARETGNDRERFARCKGS